jgi:hypothetical protein
MTFVRGWLVSQMRSTQKDDNRDDAAMARHGRATWEMSAFFQTFRACLIVGPGNHTRKHKKYNEHDCAHHHGVEWLGITP